MKFPALNPFRLARACAAAALLAGLTTLTGCLTTTVRKVNKVTVATNLQTSTLAQLLARMKVQDDALESINASVNITAQSGGSHEGEVKEIPTFAGYLFLRKPGDLRVLLLLPYVRSRALDMVTDGKTFKLLIPPKNKAITGTDAVVETSPDKPVPVPASGQPAAKPASVPSGLETIRPYIIRDALLIPALAADEFVTLTENSRITVGKGRKETEEEPDYDITVLRKREGQVLERTRVIHIGRITLEPYRQDIYDHRGRVATTVLYDKYQTVSGVDYPLSITVERPLDEYTLKIEITKLQLNGKLDDEQFALKIPDGVPVQKME